MLADIILTSFLQINATFIFCRENDTEIGLNDGVVDKPDAKLTPIEVKENEYMLQIFRQVAGADGEVDWKELKQILDLYTKKEETSVSLNVGGVNATSEVHQTSTTESNLLTAILSLVCGTLCKNTSFADVIPPPQEIMLSQAETKNQGFSKDVCRSMIAMLDRDRTGKLNFEEFSKLWTSIRNWKGVFLQHDKNNSGTLSGFELRHALMSAGYSLNNHILNILGHRYGNKSGEFEFDDFIMCAIKLKIMIELFNQVASASSKSATFTLDEWIENTLYA